MYRFPQNLNFGIVICILVNQIHGSLKIVADCGKPADVGDSVLLTCSVYGTLAYGITWKRGDVLIATCFRDMKCKSEDPALYRVGVDVHPSNMQQVTLSNTTYSDLLSSFTCCDGLDCNDNSTCRLREKTWATTEADCGKRAILGQSTVLRCMLSSKIHNGIRWYRNQILIVQCDTQRNCKSLDDRFEVFKTHDAKNQQVIIKEVSTQDLHSQFTCVDNSLIPPSLPLDSTCRLTQLISAAEKTVLYHIIGMVLVGTVILFQL
ncbi:hypothetical protein LOTGIDRAFT_165560 [Lottia gigantea]|uniref:Ig-like domain-containing protein n=1 Tax=Lottia gigantea TaxID=225164 RepID=V4A5B2_LOTGI|nr:hypothetical protein LOTGIDRAFT_165560 [Lottia gigantea]ESO88436.1 hypothetical protein LOTGIDRAFT_165560 [Lottia gigantea]